MKIILAMSGGVDSSVAALLLKRDGHEIIGAYLKTEYCNPDDRRDALCVAALLDIPLVTIDFNDAYRDKVVEPLFEGYARGITPNPDVECNSRIKFPLLWKEARRFGCDAIATGHYARIQRFHGLDHGTVHRLYCGADVLKDQTYFLHRLTQDDLSHTIFPIGDLTKPEVRLIAREAGLPVADKRSTRGVCFIGPVKMKEFIASAVTHSPGPIRTRDGKEVGEHDGAELYTVGERVPVSGAGRPWHVLEKHIETNTLVVTARDDQFLTSSCAMATDTHWISGRVPAAGRYQVKVRSRAPLVGVMADPPLSPPCMQGGEKEGGFSVHFDEPQNSLAPGQSIVLYRDDECLGGGIIK